MVFKAREHGVAESRDHGNVGPAQPFQMNLVARARKLEGIACRPRESYRGWRYREQAARQNFPFAGEPGGLVGFKTIAGTRQFKADEKCDEGD